LLVPAGVAGALVGTGKQWDDPRHLAAGALAALGRVADRRAVVWVFVGAGRPPQGTE